MIERALTSILCITRVGKTREFSLSSVSLHLPPCIVTLFISLAVVWLASALAFGLCAAVGWLSLRVSLASDFTEIFRLSRSFG